MKKNKTNNLVAESTGREKITPESGLHLARRMTIHMIPQAHIDVVWFWPPSEAVRMILHTFRGHAGKLEQNPKLTYCQSQPYAYEVVRQEDPQLFARIRKLVKKGQWELVGGEWVEADNVIPGHEACLRQFMFGQRFFEKYFGKRSEIGWSPDGFIMFPASFPQILRQAGLRAFVFKRPRERYGKLPVLPFLWRGADGSQILAYRANNKGQGLPLLSEGARAPAGKGDLAVIAETFASAGLSQLWGPMGVGDIGGINAYQPPATSRWFDCRYSTPGRYFAALAKCIQPGKLPVYNGSLPPEFTGSLTTWAGIKTLNRTAENLMQQAEFIMALARLRGLRVDLHELDPAWKRALFWQDHDSITGCGTDEVLPFAERGYYEALRRAGEMRERHMRRIAEATQVDFAEGIPVAVFNPTGHPVRGMIECRITLPPGYLEHVPRGALQSLEHTMDCRSFIPAEKELVATAGPAPAAPVMLLKYAQLQKKFVAHARFLVRDLPPFGCRVFYLKSRPRQKPPARPKSWEFKTDRLELCFDPEKGGLKRLRCGTSRALAFESLKSPLGELRIHPTGKYQINYGVELRAWETGFTGREIRLLPATRAIRAYSGNRFGIVFGYQYGASRFQQEFLVEPGADFVEVALAGDWQESEKYLKIHFAFRGAEKATAFADLPYGFTEKIPEACEYPLQYFCGLRSGRKALLVVNNGRYGCLWEHKSLSLSAIRSASYPEARSDSGPFSLAYRISAVDCARADWQAEAFQRGFEFNVAPCAYSLEYSSCRLPAEWQAFNPAANGILFTCLKPADNKRGVVVRMFNPNRTARSLDFGLPAGIRRFKETTFLEDRAGPAKWMNGKTKLVFRPYEIKTLVLEP